MDKSRYQYQPWYIKIWRHRHYISVPYYAVKVYLLNDMPLSVAWNVNIGIAQVKMNWYYTSAETRERANKIINK